MNCKREGLNRLTGDIEIGLEKFEPRLPNRAHQMGTDVASPARQQNLHLPSSGCLSDDTRACPTEQPRNQGMHNTMLG